MSQPTSSPNDVHVTVRTSLMHTRPARQSAVREAEAAAAQRGRRIVGEPWLVGALAGEYVDLVWRTAKLPARAAS